MRPQDSTWQGCFGYWQNLFIRENLLPLGHAAWQGFITQGRGIVVCDMALVDAESVDWNSDIVEYTLQFVPLPNISAYLQSLSLEATLIERLIDTVQTYDPAQAILLLIYENGRADINLLQNLKVSPMDCCQQVQRRWVEFQLDQSPGDLYEQRL
ncbi:MAG: hypothetical protein MUF49_09135 [Oculatellaceae cyanobacterium Prado106]|jgi:hypothetical protein|nr:hypothetical protein [Oculatellaceae cyanobacterium Prado106]